MITLILVLFILAIIAFIVMVISLGFVLYDETRDCNHDDFLFFGSADDDHVAVKCLKCGRVKEIENK